jgi:hypothetical protein
MAAAAHNPSAGPVAQPVIPRALLPGRPIGDLQMALAGAAGGFPRNKGRLWAARGAASSTCSSGFAYFGSGG